jgi:biotin carboxylase
MHWNQKAFQFWEQHQMRLIWPKIANGSKPWSISLGLKQPKNGIAHSDAEALEIAEDIGFPLVIRPSYVLGGRAMEIVRDMDQLRRYIREAVVVSGDSPVLLDSYLSGAVECDVDALSDGKNVHVAGIMQHIEEAACIPVTAPVHCRPIRCQLRLSTN